VVSNFSAGPKGERGGGIDRILLRLAVLGVLVVVAFVGLFSRLWFLQVLASEEYNALAQENRVRLVYSEPPRGLILDRDGDVLVQNRQTLAVTVDKQTVNEDAERKRLLRRLAKVLDVKKKQLEEKLNDTTVSPYKPVAVAYDVPKKAILWIDANSEDYPGVAIEKLSIREYPQGRMLAQMLGYVGEISEDDLELPLFKNADPRYEPGDLVGKAGLERAYDRWLRGTPRIERIVVNSTGRVVHAEEIQQEEPGNNLVLAIDAQAQKVTEKALGSGIKAARGAGYEAPEGAAFVMNPITGEVIASASFPSYDPSMLADGFSQKEYDELIGSGEDAAEESKLLNRAIQAQVPPGSTFKVVTAGAAIANGVIGPHDTIDCNPTFVYGADNRVFANWTSADMGPMALARSLEVSCDTYYYQLGAWMEDRWGWANGDRSERFQAYMRKAGFGAPTGIDVPGETAGVVPDRAWCAEMYEQTDGALCPDDWQPGYSVNMSIGQGDLLVTPAQMAVTFAAILNGGEILEPRVALQAEKDDRVVARFKTKVRHRLPIGPEVWDEMKEGLELVVSGADGTATSAFAGFPLERVPVGGKTGTAQIGSVDSGKNYAWFVSYAPADDPQYLIAVYLGRAGHGGESAGPVARQIFEGIFGIDGSAEVQLSVDGSR